MPDTAVPARSTSDDDQLRGRMLRLGALPAGAAAVLFAATAGYLWADGVTTAEIVLIAAFLAGLVFLALAAARAVRAAGQAADRIVTLRAEAGGARAELGAARADAAQLRADATGLRAEGARARAEVAAVRGELDAAHTQATAALGEATAARAAAAVTQAEARAEGRAEGQAEGQAALDAARADAAAEAHAARQEAAAALAEAEALRERLRAAEAQPVPVRSQSGRQVEVFVNLSRRLQSLVHREILLLDALENEVEDPDLLKGLFQVDHLATRIRRHAENLAVLGGAVSRRQWSRPVALTEVLRSAIAEVEHYSRVKLVPPIEGTVPGHAVAGIIHLVAELIENATMFAPPQTQVLLRAQPVTAGMVVEVEDRGLGLQPADRDRVNRLLADPDDINLDELLEDGRIGLFVVSMIARQHGITVQLQINIYGGTQAVIVLPPHLLGPSRSEAPARPAVAARSTVSVSDRPADLGSPVELTAGAPLVPTGGPTAEIPLVRGTARAPLATPPPDWPSLAPPGLGSALPSIGPLPSSPAVTPTLAGPVPVLPPATGVMSEPYAGRPGDPGADRLAPEEGDETAAMLAVHLTAEERAATGARSDPPPLPRRTSQTHLAPQLQSGPPTRADDEDEGAHDPGLMASFMQGVSRGEAGAPAGTEPR